MRIGVDLGGTKTEGIVLGDDGAELSRRRVATPVGDYEGSIATVCALVDELAALTGAGDDTPVGVGIPGTISPATGLIKNANSTWLIGKSLDKDLAASLGRPVKLANDADCFAMSEASDGAGEGFSTVFGVILGTGVGGGIVVGGRLLSGPNAIVGEWGHNPLPAMRDENGYDERPGRQCYCGRRGCIETFLSGPGLSADHLLHTGEDLSAVRIAAMCEDGVREAEATMDRYCERLARSLAVVINIIDPGVVVLGGGVSNAARIYQRVPEILPRYVFSDTTATKLRKNHHGDSSGVRGAAWLWRYISFQ